jgi:peptidoglycan-associated lipoprotein
MPHHAIWFPISCVALGVALTACTSTPATRAPVVAVPTQAAAATDAGASAGAAAVTTAPPAGAPSQANAGPGGGQAVPPDGSVYFAFDSAVVASSYEPVILTNEKYLQNRGQLKVQVQGNADERGSREYNLALGNKRAEAVRRELVMSGLNAGRVEAVSFGKEKPKALGHDEQAWAQNRRADIVATP